MAAEAFDDQCTGANPRYPLISELKEVLRASYYGEVYVEGETFAGTTVIKKSEARAPARTPANAPDKARQSDKTELSDKTKLSAPAGKPAGRKTKKEKADA